MIVTVQDVAVFPLVSGPISSTPSACDCPGVAEQPCALNW
jgi:hypothetical protein